MSPAQNKTTCQQVYHLALGCINSHQYAQQLTGNGLADPVCRARMQFTVNTARQTSKHFANFLSAKLK
ncbi:MAG: hypothetical protein GF390_02350 [Candidatus Pacebacteria bacterium]|nr:hypothetical protein [Candidatus Paceibacterota bacterium]